MFVYKNTLHCSVTVEERTVLLLQLFQTIWSEFIQYASKLAKWTTIKNFFFVLNPTLILFLGILLCNKQIIYLFVEMT